MVGTLRFAHPTALEEGVYPLAITDGPRRMGPRVRGDDHHE